MLFVQIAIDGPGGSGKSTLAKALAQELNYLYVNTGLIFRGLVWYMLKHSMEDPDEMLLNIAKHKNFTFEKNKWIFNGKEIDGNELISKEVTSRVSELASIQSIRNFVLLIERDLASKNNVIMDGRDIGTAVFPNAILKIFLTTDIHIRAERRYKELKEKGMLNDRTIEEITKSLRERDKKDSEREIAPLIKAKDAVEMSGNEKSVSELVEEAKQMLNSKLRLKKN